DLIAGFPTETEEMFARTLDIVDECGIAYLHVFPYSERAGTPAAKMPAVPKPVRRERAARLRAAGAERLDAFLDAHAGRTVQVLAEDGDAGRAEDYAPVALDRPATPGSIVAARITGRRDATLTAEALA
ncbi:MAG: tRNA (N(6)-L-threonylcarbamoyladenosine(37)-C(2))-methylthiotransferase MtaB, partial [Rhodospirillaceae bacterium]